MTSAELKAARGQLIGSVNSFISQIKGLSGPASSAGKTLSDTNDTLMKNEISNKGKQIVQAIDDGVSKVEGELSSALSKIDAKIIELEREEERARLNALKKAAKKESNTNTETSRLARMERM